jgi:hypothetical protein
MPGFVALSRGNYIGQSLEDSVTKIGLWQSSMEYSRPSLGECREDFIIELSVLNSLNRFIVEQYPCISAEAAVAQA